MPTLSKTPLPLLLSVWLLAGCAGLNSLTAPQFSDHAKKLEQYALWSQTLYHQSPPVPSNGEVHIVRYGGPLGESSTKYLLVTDDSSRMHSIVIQGTGNLQNLGIGADMLPSYDARIGARVHGGFRQMAQAVHKDVTPRLKERYSVSLAGHSAGGAAAQLVAHYLQADGRVVNEIYTFGQPKFADGSSTTAKSSLQERTVRVINCDDAIPLFPSFGPAAAWLTGRYAHTGPVIYLGEDGRVWYSDRDVEIGDLDSVAKSVVRDLFVGKPFRAHLIETYVERIRGAKENPPATSYTGTGSICAEVSNL
jgi:hypothetical protein